MFIVKKITDDGRVSRVYLTEKGLAVREPIEQIWRKQQDKLLKGLTDGESYTLK